MKEAKHIVEWKANIFLLILSCLKFTLFIHLSQSITHAHSFTHSLYAFSHTRARTHIHSLPLAPPSTYYLNTYVVDFLPLLFIHSFTFDTSKCHFVCIRISFILPKQFSLYIILVVKLCAFLFVNSIEN